MPQDRLAIQRDGIVTDYADAEMAPVQSEEEEELIKSIDSWFKDDLDAKSGYESDWEFHRSYVKGEQLIARNSATGETIRISEDDSKRLRSMMNVLRPTCRSLIGKMTRTIPSWEVIPATADFEEIHGAQVAKALLDYAWREQRLDAKYVHAHEYIPFAGNAFLQLVWNRFKGRKLAYCFECDYQEADEEMIGEICPQCMERQRMAAQQHEMNVMMAKEQAMMSVMDQMPPGTIPSPDMMPADFEEPMPPDDMFIEPAPMVEVREGQPEVIVRDPRFVFPEAGAESILESQRVTVRVPMPVQTLRQMFPAYAQFIKAEDELVVDQVGTLRGGYLDDEAYTEILHDHAFYWEIHEIPTERFPHGRVLYRVNDMIVRQLGIDVLSEVPEEEQADNPYYVLGRHPFFHLGFDRNPGEFWFESFIAQSWHRQREINRLETSMREWAEQAMLPRMFIPMGSRISTDEISARGPQLIKYNAAAGEPRPVDFPPWPPEMIQRRNELIADIRMQASITEQDMGVSPTDPNGRAMAIIEAESDQQLGAILVRNWSEWRALARAYIELFRANANPELLFSVAGPEGVQTFSFDQLVLKPGWDVVLEEEDGLSKNKAVRLQQALDLANAGMFIDPLTGQPDKKAFARHAKLNMPEQGYDIERTERAAASQIPYKVLQALKNGEEPPWQPQMEDDPAIFAEVLTGWLRGPGRQIEASNPEAVQIIRQIWQFYAQWAIMDMTPGGAGGPPGLGTDGSGAGGPDQSAPGGSTNNPGNMGTDVATQASAQVNEADQAAESQAQVQSNHEG